MLLRAWSRILYNAWILHYVKNLDVFLRPDPRPAIPNWTPEEALTVETSSSSSNGNGIHTDDTSPQIRVLEKDNGAYTLSLDLSNQGKQVVSGGVGWQPESSSELFARKRVAGFLVRRVKEVGVDVLFVSANPSVARREFRPTRSFSDDVEVDEKEEKGKKEKTLVISHMSSTVFSTLFWTPSAEHALKVGEEEGQFFVND